ncbi:hypothetical protein SDC9_149026 [bioreactor metagenome]|uniref:Uncharacterized protein n=1 Tax=bioreactor metagenome TaxID=1076179 RepID=A0A645EMC3_9ZZZZ
MTLPMIRLFSDNDCENADKEKFRTNIIVSDKQLKKDLYSLILTCMLKLVK